MTVCSILLISLHADLALVCVILDLLNVEIGVIRKQRRVLPGAVPSVFYWTQVDSSTAIARRRRASLRDTMRATAMPTQPTVDSENQLDNDDSTAAVTPPAPDVAAVETVQQPPSPRICSMSRA